MIPLRLELEGFLSYRDQTVIDFDGIHAAAIVGENGSGKTSLIEAIAWALYGEGRGRGPDDFVTAGRTLASVTFDFELAGALYRVHRERSLAGGGKSDLRLEAPTAVITPAMREDRPFMASILGSMPRAPVGGDHIREVQASIVRLIGLSYEQWIATSYIAQGRADTFTRLSPRERKALLGEILELDRFDVATSTVKSAAAALSGQMATWMARQDALKPLLMTAEQIRAAVADADRQDREARAALDAVQLDAATARERFAEAVRAYDRAQDARDAREGYEAEIQTVREAIARLEAESDQLVIEDVRGLVRQQNDATVRRAELQRQVEKLADELADAIGDVDRRHLDRVQAEMDAQDAQGLRDRLAGVGAECPTCGRPLDDDARTDLLRDARADLAGAEERMKKAEGEGEAAHQEVERIRAAARDAYEQQQRAVREVTELAVRIERAEAAGARAQEISGMLANYRLREAGLETAIQAVPAPSLALEQAVTEARAEVKRQEDVVRAAVDQVRDTTRDAANAQAELARLEAATHETDELERQVAEGGGLSADLDKLVRAFGPDGIPAIIVAQAIPAIEAEANRILERLAAGRYTVEIRGQRALKTGGLRDTLDVIVADDVSERPLESLSGGERQAVDLALRIGLSRLVAHRADRSVRALFLDEAFTALDSGRRQTTIQVIHGLIGEFDQIWFVTHDLQMADAFPVTMRVARVDGTSSVTVEGKG